jgi:hypothetical protein
MLGSIHVLPGADLSTGAIVLTVFIAGAMLALLAAFGVVAFRRAGESGLSGNLWRGGLIVVGIILAWIVLDRSSIRDQMTERRSIETRAAELTVRAMAPGSALACLDAVAGATIETACEKALFASPEAVAAAVTYVDARLSLLASSIAVSQRDPAMRSAVERMRRAIEGDRFGLVAHVLMTRGCTSTDCPDLKLVRDTSRIMSNMRSRAFDTHVNVHARAWNPGGVTVNTLATASSTPAAPPHSPPAMALQPSVSATQPPAFLPQQQPVAAAPAMPEQPMVSAGPAPGHPPAPGAKYDYPSSASIPAVSIMTAEPAGPPAAEAKPAAAPRRPAHSQQQRNSSSREAAPRQSAPQPAQQAAPPQTSGAR